jgi:hypothetical protein
VQGLDSGALVTFAVLFPQAIDLDRPGEPQLLALGAPLCASINFSA